MKQPEHNGFYFDTHGHPEKTLPPIWRLRTKLPRDVKISRLKKTSVSGYVVCALGMIIDLAHADEETILPVTEATIKPVICSHTGPRNVQDFPRYISDRAICAIAGTGGLIGLWPFFSRGAGVGNPDILPISLESNTWPSAPT